MNSSGSCAAQAWRGREREGGRKGGATRDSVTVEVVRTWILWGKWRFIEGEGRREKGLGFHAGEADPVTSPFILVQGKRQASDREWTVHNRSRTR